MPSVNEASGDTELKSGLIAAIDTISSGQKITFTKYTKLILPADGFVFWVKTSDTLIVRGSLHYSGDQSQSIDESIAINRVILTTDNIINDFNEIAPTTLWIGDAEGLKFSFNHQKNFYKQAGIYHYVGNAVYPPMLAQLIDDVSGFDALSPVVSNSLPIWLSLNALFPVYPSFLVDPNIAPPYASIDITNTNAMQSSPVISESGSHYQLVSDHVKFTLYGIRNDLCLDFMDYVLQHSIDTDNFGVMNMPIMRDEKRTQSELNVIAQKKTFELDVSYYQARVKEISRQLILSSIPTFILQ